MSRLVGFSHFSRFSALLFLFLRDRGDLLFLFTIFLEERVRLPSCFLPIFNRKYTKLNNIYILFSFP